MRYRITTCASNWVEVWINKYSLILEEKKLPATEALFYRTLVRQYLTQNPGNPREIAIAKLKKFVSGRKEDVTAPFVLFYESVAPSENHLKVLMGIRTRRKK